MAALDALPGRVGNVPARLWWRALHFVAFFTAERIGSILQIEWSDVNLQTGWLVCRAETRKFGAADKATRLPREAIESLRAIIEPERKLIFEWPMTGSSLYLHYKRILRRAGLSTDRKSKFHMLRRSAASHFKAAGGDPQALLGHSSLKTTAGYIDPRICPAPASCGPAVCSRGCRMTNDELRAVIRALRSIQSGETFKAHHVRIVLVEARCLESRLDKALTAVFNARHKAEREFCTGWPRATKSLWHLE